MARLNLLEEHSTANSTSFWAVWMALARAVGVPLTPKSLLIDDIVGIKERLFRLYEGFVTNPAGLPRWGLRDALYPSDVDVLFPAPALRDQATREQLDVVVSVFA